MPDPTAHLPLVVPEPAVPLGREAPPGHWIRDDKRDEEILASSGGAA